MMKKDSEIAGGADRAEGVTGGGSLWKIQPDFIFRGFDIIFR